MTLTGMKKHVGVLELAGFVTTEKVGRVRTCKLGLHRLAEEAAWIERYRKHWEERFDELDKIVEELKIKEDSMDEKRESEPNAMKNPTTVERKSEREIVVTRTFNGPAHIVFEAWSKPELLKRWWTPKSFGMSFDSCEPMFVRGGTYRFVFSHPNFDQPMAFQGRYIEVTPTSRIVWTNEEEADGPISTVTFEEKDGKTQLTLLELYPSKKALDDAIESGSTGTSAAGEQFDELDELLVTLVK